MPARGSAGTSARAVHNRVVRDRIGRPSRNRRSSSGHLFGCSKAIARIFRQGLQDDDFQITRNSPVMVAGGDWWFMRDLVH